MKKYCRVGYLFSKTQKQVIETFSYNPFKVIADKALLDNCIECPEGTVQNMYYVNGAFIPELEYKDTPVIDPEIDMEGLSFEELAQLIKWRNSV